MLFLRIAVYIDSDRIQNKIYPQTTGLVTSLVTFLNPSDQNVGTGCT